MHVLAGMSEWWTAVRHTGTERVQSERWQRPFQGHVDDVSLPLSMTIDRPHALPVRPSERTLGRLGSWDRATLSWLSGAPASAPIDLISENALGTPDAGSSRPRNVHGASQRRTRSEQTRISSSPFPRGWQTWPCQSEARARCPIHLATPSPSSGTSTPP
ncbi:hypothetical protein C8Q76DRAFT_357773 [Earliella scabrosa]|nr:hypothetical protein C8Q76DRAFT_357773 [Earliella scabrosa]